MNEDIKKLFYLDGLKEYFEENQGLFLIMGVFGGLSVYLGRSVGELEKTTLLVETGIFAGYLIVGIILFVLLVDGLVRFSKMDDSKFLQKLLMLMVFMCISSLIMAAIAIAGSFRSSTAAFLLVVGPLSGGFLAATTTVILANIPLINKNKISLNDREVPYSLVTIFTIWFIHILIVIGIRWGAGIPILYRSVDLSGEPGTFPVESISLLTLIGSASVFSFVTIAIIIQILRQESDLLRD